MVAPISIMMGHVIQAKLLGTPRLKQGDLWLEPAPSKTSALLYYLAYQGGWVSRDEVMVLFWPDTLESKARSNLRQRLSMLRKLPHTDALEVEKLRLRWSVEVDVKTFKIALERDDSGEAFRHYGGELLSGFRLGEEAPEFESWLETERQALHREWRGAVFSLASELGSSQRFPEAARVLERLQLADPVDEEALRRYLECLYLGGRRDAALHAFERFAQSLESDLGGEPEDSTLALIETIRQERRLEGASGSGAATAMTVEPARQDSQSPTRPQHNLPPQPTRFVGREGEKAQLRAQLSDPTCRLVTIVGPGGIGKTRLALEVARGQLDVFTDGVCFVSFTSLTSPESIPDRIAEALDLTMFMHGDVTELILSFLQGKNMLLVLDNLEHLLEGVGFIRDIWQHAPQVKLLATSRERLNLQAEQVHTLEGLSQPQEGEASTEPSDAVRLFLQSAERSGLEVALTDEDTPAIARICQMVGGMPLAIELAASWLRALTPADIAEEIEQGLGVLRVSTRDAPERHKSIRAVFDHSWKLLTSGEQLVLRKLAVFRGGFTREAAREIAGASLPLLAGLVDKSFLRRTHEGRYRRHPLVLEYAAERLAGHPEERAETEEKQGRYYLELVRAQVQGLFTRRHVETRQLLSEELANIRAAWSWAVATTKLDEIEETAYPLSQILRVIMWEGEEVFAEAIAGLDETNPRHHLALGRVLIGHDDLLISRRQRSSTAAQRGLELLRAQHDDLGIAWAFIVAGAGGFYAGLSEAKIQAFHLEGVRYPAFRPPSW